MQYYKRKNKNNFEKKNIITQLKEHKKKKIHINLMRLNSMKSIYLKEIVIRIAFLHFIYVVVFLIVNVITENIKIKTIFDNETKINYMFK